VKIKQISIVTLHFFLRFVIPIIVPFALLFAKKSNRVTTHYGQDPAIQRYTLPKPFKWLLTPDEDLAGGMYEPTVKKIYDKFGWYICSWYWIGFRNQGQGLLWTQGFEVTEMDYFIKKHMGDKPLSKFPTRRINLYWFKIVFEWEIAHDHYLDYTTTGYFAIPKMSLKRN
jgi:hypothetical protein